MIKLTLKEICEATSSEIKLLGGNINMEMVFDNVSTDSRNICVGDLFVPIVGERFDGHAYVHDVITKGAKASFVERSKKDDILKRIDKEHDACLLIVEDSLMAFHKLASYILKKMDIPVVAVTGSVGKTTTKEMLFEVLSMKYKVLKNEGNLNNHVGVPITICRMEENHEMAVIEMGMNHFGEIDLLANTVRPETAVITNIGMSHIGNLGSQKGILKAKMEITNYFTETSTLLINGDDRLLLGEKEKGKPFNVIAYGLSDDCDCNVADVVMADDGTYSYVVEMDGMKIQIELNVLGKHNVGNSLLAVGVGMKFGIEPKLIAQGVANFEASGRRMNVVRLREDLRVINDSYNAATDSMLAALEVLSSFDKDMKIAVLGDMLEMGEQSSEEHYKVGKAYGSSSIDYLYLFGSAMMNAKVGAIEGGLAEANVIHFEDMNALTGSLVGILNDNKNKFKSILVKGSLGMAMDRVLKALEETN